MQKIKASRKWKCLKKAIKKNIEVDRFMLLEILSVLYTVTYLGTHIPLYVQTYDSVKYYAKAYKESKNISENTLDEYEEELNNTIICGNFRANIDTPYTLNNGILYNTKTNQMVDLSFETKNLVLSKNGVSNNTLKKMNLKDSKIEAVLLDQSVVTDGFTEELPSSLTCLYISRCDYITNLNGLSESCPLLKELALENITSLDSYDFIYDLKDLETLSVRGSYGITDELLDYCSKSDIKVISNGNEVKNTNKIKEIANEILTPDMNDTDKIKAICSYVIDNISYSYDLTTPSNRDPLTYALEGEGVCISYSYLTSALLKEADIKSYRVNSASHVWNLVKLDDEYFYIDPTGMDSAYIVRIIYKIFGKSPFYLYNPNHNTFLSSKDVSSEEANIPDELKKDILARVDEETLFKKYGATVGISVIVLLEVAVTLMLCLSIPMTIEALDDLRFNISCVAYSYKSLKREEIRKNKH